MAGSDFCPPIYTNTTDERVCLDQRGCGLFEIFRGWRVGGGTIAAFLAVVIVALAPSCLGCCFGVSLWMSPYMQGLTALDAYQVAPGGPAATQAPTQPSYVGASSYT